MPDPAISIHEYGSGRYRRTWRWSIVLSVPPRDGGKPNGDPTGEVAVSAGFDTASESVPRAELRCDWIHRGYREKSKHRWSGQIPWPVVHAHREEMREVALRLAEAAEWLAEQFRLWPLEKVARAGEVEADG